MVSYNIVVRVADDKDFLTPIFKCIGQLNKDGIDASLTVVGKVYDEGIYNRLVTFSQQLGIAGKIHFTKQSIRYKDMDDTLRNGIFLNYSLGDVVGYSTMEAMNEGLKTVLFNCDPSIHESDSKISFCNDVDDLYNLTALLSQQPEKTTEKIIEENKAFRKSFFLDENEKQLLLTMF